MEQDDNDFDPIKKFDFLLGGWDLDYVIPRSFLSEAGSDSGIGSFYKVLNDKYVIFEYSTKSGSEAKGIFAWESKTGVYKYWWFENSGSYLTATCNFINDNIMAMNWHDSLLVQTFVKENPDRIILKMQYPSIEGGHNSVLEVLFTRRIENQNEKKQYKT